jgi:hypothetical protein
VQPNALLLQSAATGDINGIRTALTLDQPVGLRDADGWFALALAAYSGKALGVPCTLLVSRGADVDMRLPNGATPLYLAAQNGHLGAVSKLLDCGADMDLLCNGLRAVDVARRRNSQRVVAALTKAGHSPTPLQLSRRIAREAAALEHEQLVQAVTKVQGMFRSKMARRQMSAKREAGSGRYVDMPDLQMEGCGGRGCWAGFKFFALQSVPLFVSAGIVCFDKLLDWAVFLAWAADSELRGGGMWWAPWVSLLIICIAGALGALVALDEPHNLSTAGYGDKDPRFLSGKLRRAGAVALAGVGALPLTYALGYARLGPGSAAARCTNTPFLPCTVPPTPSRWYTPRCTYGVSDSEEVAGPGARPGGSRR